MELDTTYVLIMQEEGSDMKLNNEVKDLIQKMLCSYLEVMKLEFINRFSLSQINRNQSVIMFIWGKDSKEWLERNETKVLFEYFIENLYKRTFVNVTKCIDSFIPQWARQLQLFDLTINNISLKSLNLFLKQEPKLTRAVSEREHRDFDIPYEEAMRVIHIADNINSNNLNSLIPNEFSKGENEMYKFKSNKNLLWYLMFLGVIEYQNPIESLKSYLTEMKESTSGELIKQARPNTFWDEQPKANGYRFRYECEGPTHGGVPGDDSNKNNKSHPSIMVKNYEGKIIIIGHLLAEDRKLQNVNRLIGKEVYRGVLITQTTVNQSSQRMDLNNISIQHCKKKQYKQSVELQLKMRLICEKVGVKSIIEILSDKNQTKESLEKIITELENKHLQYDEFEKIEETSKEMSICPNAASARLRVKVYIENQSDHSFKLLDTLISQTIYDSQAANSTQPKISKLNIYSGVFNGGDEMIILCEKIQKQDLEVVFSELPNNETNGVWSQTIEVGSHNVHYQYAIIINTPPYKEAVESPRKVYISLKRKSDRSSSTPLEFIYKPQEDDPEKIGFKRQKR